METSSQINSTLVMVIVMVMVMVIKRVSGKPLKVWWGLWNVLRLGRLDLHNFSLLIDFTLPEQNKLVYYISALKTIS